MVEVAFDGSKNFDILNINCTAIPIVIII